MGFRTEQIHAGVEPDPVTGAILTPIHQSTTYVQESVDRYLEKGYSYSRSANPTVRALEHKLTKLERGADCCTFSTGMAAINATMLALLNTGEHAIVSDVAYGGARQSYDAAQRHCCHIQDRERSWYPPRGGQHFSHSLLPASA